MCRVDIPVIPGALCSVCNAPATQSAMQLTSSQTRPIIEYRCDLHGCEKAQTDLERISEALGMNSEQVRSADLDTILWWIWQLRAEREDLVQQVWDEDIATTKILLRG